MSARACARLLSLLPLALLLGLGACIDPEDRRPGLRLSGEVVEGFPDDWSFTDEHREIAIEVATPYLLPHSVTIWCASLNGDLYVGARDPEEKSWPGWVEADPDVRLEVGERVYEVGLELVEAPGRIAELRRAYAAKYDTSGRAPDANVRVRYWRVVPRSQ